MRALFVHDHVFLNDGGDYFSSGKLPYTTWLRYLKFFDELVVVARVKKLDSLQLREGLDLSSGPGVSFFPVPTLSTPRAFLTKRSQVKPMLRDLVHSADGVIVRLPSITASLVGEMALELGKPWAAEVVGCAWDAMWNHGSLKGKLAAPQQYLSARHLISAAPFVLYVTDRFLQDRYPTRGLSWSCSDVDIPELNPSVLGRRLQRNAEGRSEFRIGTIASLNSRYKGIETALRALRLIRGVSPKPVLAILGAGDPSPWRQLATELGVVDNVVFAGTLPGGTAVHQWIDNIDLYVQPSLTEGLPRALVEALSRGCPAVGSRVGGIPELLPEECLHSPGDYRALSNLITAAMGSSELLSTMAKANFEKAGQYTAGKLEARRDSFWAEVRQSWLSGK